MTLPASYPARIWVCPGCQRPFQQRWLLARHLRSVHRLRRNKADEIAYQSEYRLSPTYYKKEEALNINPSDYYEDVEK